MVNRNLLLSQMALKGISTKNFADAQSWSKTTAYRKINGQTAFTAPEIQKCVELLELDTQTANDIFFNHKMS